MVKKNVLFIKLCDMKKIYVFTFIILIVCYTSFSSAKENAEFKFNFVNVDLTTVIKFVSEVTGKNFIFDDRVKGKVTIIAPSKLKIRDIEKIFTSLLELKGFTIIPLKNNTFKIVPAFQARSQGIKVSDRIPIDESYIARVIPLQYISALQAMKFLRPLISKNGHISAFAEDNLLLVIDSGLNLEKIISIVKYIDKPIEENEAELVLLKYANSEEVAKILNEAIGHQKKPKGIEPKAIAEKRLNGVIIIGDKEIKQFMKRLISLVDIPVQENQDRINVYFLENADATELAKVLEGIIQSTQTSKKTNSPFELSGHITITPDKSTNALIIVASPSDYQNLLRVIKQLDKRKKQVFVEAMIVEASIDKLKEIGTKWRVMATHDNAPISISGFGTISMSDLQSLIYGLTGLSFGGMGSFTNIKISTLNADGTVTETTLDIPRFAALFSLDEFKGAVNVLSTPHILTSDNEEAEIVVGENVPFITRRESDPTRPLSVFSTIERKDVGITLRITPHITEGEYVRLDIYQEISSVKRESENILISLGPTTTKRSTKTSVVVKNNQTVVIGGLMQEREEKNIHKIPILGDIPILRYLFRYESKIHKKTNLLVFLTPRIVKDSKHLSEITKEKKIFFERNQKWEQ